MAAVVVPGQSRRWGNESTNFYEKSYSQNPRQPSRDYVYRCGGHQYTNSGHFHHGAKIFNLHSPQDMYGTKSAQKLRTIEVTSRPVHQIKFPVPPQTPADLYQSHRQYHYNYAMSSPSLIPPQEDSEHQLTRSLNNTFYTTTYENDNILSSRRCKSAQTIRSPTSSNCPAPLTLREHLASRQVNNQNHGLCPSGEMESYAKVSNAATTVHHSPAKMPSLRHRATGKVRTTSSSKSETVRDIFELFPSPKSPALSLWSSRPSSAVLLKRGSIPHLRTN